MALSTPLVFVRITYFGDYVCLNLFPSEKFYIAEMDDKEFVFSRHVEPVEFSSWTQEMLREEDELDETWGDVEWFYEEDVEGTDWKPCNFFLLANEKLWWSRYVARKRRGAYKVSNGGWRTLSKPQPRRRTNTLTRAQRIARGFWKPVWVERAQSQSGTTRDERDAHQRACAKRAERKRRQEILKEKREAYIRTARSKKQQAKMVLEGAVSQGAFEVSAIAGTVLGSFAMLSAAVRKVGDRASSALEKTFKNCMDVLMKHLGKTMWLIPFCMILWWLITRPTAIKNTVLITALWIGARAVLPRSFKSRVAEFFRECFPALKACFPTKGLGQPPEAVSQMDFGSSDACRAIALLLSLSVFKTCKHPGTEFMKRIAMSANFCTGMEGFIDWIFDVMGRVRDGITSVFSQEKKEAGNSMRGAYSNWRAAVLDISKKFDTIRMPVEPKIISRVRALVDEGYMFSEVYHGTRMWREVDTLHKKVISIMSLFAGSVTAANNFRIEPVMCMFLGDPGIGKTSMLVPLLTAIGCKIGLWEKAPSQEEIQSQMWQKGISDFYNGYAGQFFYIMDDACQRRAATQLTQSDYMEIISAINNFSYPLNMADLQSKGRIYFSSKMVMATTNLTSLRSEAGQLLVKPEAVIRRIAFPYKLYLKPEYSRIGVQGTREMDWTKFHAETVKCQDAEDPLQRFPWYIWECAKHDFMTGITEADRIGVDELIEKMTVALLDRKHNFEVTCKYTEDYAAGFFNYGRQREHPPEAESQAQMGSGYSYYHVLGLPQCAPMSAVRLRLREMTLENHPDKGGDHEFMQLLNEIRSVLTDEKKKAFYDEHGFYEEPNVPKVEWDVWVQTLIGWAIGLYGLHLVLCLAKGILSGVLNTILKLFGLKHDPVKNQKVQVLGNKQAVMLDKDDSNSVKKFERDLLSALVKYVNSWKHKRCQKFFLTNIYIVVSDFDMCVHFVVRWNTNVLGRCYAERHAAHFQTLRKYGMSRYGPIMANVLQQRLDEVYASEEFELSDDADAVSQSNIPRLRVTRDIPRAQSQGLPDLTRQLMDKAMENAFSVSMELCGAWRNVGTMLFVDGPMAVHPKHFLSMTMSAPADTKVKLVSGVGSSFDIEFTLGHWRKLKHYDVSDSDISFTDFTGVFQGRKNITKNFIRSGDLQVLSGKRMSLSRLFPDRRIVTTLFTSATYEEAPLIIGGADIVANRYWRYQSNTCVNGDCGSVLMVDDMATRGGAVYTGIHIAGGTTSAFGYSAVITQELICEARSHLTLPTDNFIECMGDKLNVDYAFSQGELSHLEGKCFMEFGVTPLFAHTPINTKYFPVPETMNHFGPSGLAPARLSPFVYDGELKVPMENALENYGSGFVTTDPDFCDNVVWNAMKKFNECTMNSTRRILTPEEAVLGVPGEKFRSIPRGTSAGWPFCVSGRGKFSFFGDGEDYDLTSPKWFELLERVRSVEMRAKAGIRCDHVFMDFLKDELRDETKVNQGKTRLISAAPVDYVILWRMYFGAFSMAFMGNHTVSGMAPGICAYSEWDSVVAMISHKGPDVIAGDFRAFDASEQPSWLWAILRFVNLWYNDGPINAMVRTVLWMDLVHSRHVGGKGKRQNIIYQWYKSLPSGHPFTTVVNSIYSLSLLVACYASVKDVTTFWLFCSAVTFGDDNLLNIDRSIVPIFNQSVIARIMQEKFGLVYTSDKKDGKYVETSTLSDVTFLKRSFRKENGKWLAPLDLNSFLYTSYWCKNRALKEEILKDNLELALAELSLHEPSVWDQYAPQVRDLMRKLGHESKLAPTRAVYQAMIIARDDLWY